MGRHFVRINGVTRKFPTRDELKFGSGRTNKFVISIKEMLASYRVEIALAPIRFDFYNCQCKYFFWTFCILVFFLKDDLTCVSTSLNETTTSGIYVQCTFQQQY